MTLFRMLRSKKGQSLIELMLIAPLMMALTFGAIEVGSVISTYLTMSHTTREGANLASRGTPPAQALAAIVAAAAPTLSTGNQAQWRIIYSRIIPDPLNQPAAEPYNFIVDTAFDGQLSAATGTLSKASKLGTPGTPVTQAILPGIQNVKLQKFHVIEVFFDYAPSIITYVGRGINTDLYERTIFTDVGGS
jgi:Tfp pilus assembly protein PilW